MVNSSPESSGGKVERVEVGQNTGPSPEKLRARREERNEKQKALELARAKVLPEGTDGFRVFQAENQLHTVEAEAKDADVEALMASPDAVPTLSAISIRMAELNISKPLDKPLSLVDNEEALALVAEDRKIQAETLTGIIIPESSKPRGGADKRLRERTGDDLLKEDGSSRFVTINDEPKAKIQEDVIPQTPPTKAPFLRDAIDLIRERDARIKAEQVNGEKAQEESGKEVENKTPEKLDVDIENRKKVMGAKNFDELFAVMDSFGASFPSETHGTIPTEHLKTMISNYENGVTPVHFGSGPDALTYITKTYGLRDKVYDLLIFSQKLENLYIKNYEERNQQEAQEKIDSLKETDAIIARQQARFREKGLIEKDIEEIDPKVKAEEEAARKLKELNDFKKIAAEYTANDDMDAIGTTEKKRRFTPEEYAAQIEIWKKSIEGSEKAVENAEKALQESREKSKKNLEAMGLTKVGKGLEAFKNMSGKKKLLLGIALAGLSVATGGTTSFISTGLSALTFGLRDFDKEKAKAQEKGETTTKGTMLKSAITGLVLALGTGALFHLAGDAVSAASEHFSPMMENIKHFFSPDHAIASTPDITPGIASTPDVVPLTPPAPSVIPDAGIIGSTPDAIMGALPSLPTDYVIQPGDNLTNIIREHIFTSADATSGFNALSHTQQENVIQNFVQSGAFPNPDHIMAGATLDLNSIRDSILGGSVNGEALISHAGTLDSASIADNIRNGMSDAVATGEPSVVTGMPSPTEVDLGAVATEANGSAPFVSEPIVNMDAQPATTYTSAPAVAMPPEGSVLLDGSGNQVLDGSGNPVHLTNYEGGIGSFGDTQFTSALNSGTSPISPQFNQYVQDRFMEIPDTDILKMKESLLNTVRNGNDEHLKALFEGKGPGDLKITPYLGNVELIAGTQDGQVIGASFKPNGLFNDDLHKNGLDLSKLMRRP